MTFLIFHPFLRQIFDHLLKAISDHERTIDEQAQTISELRKLASAKDKVMNDDLAKIKELKEANKKLIDGKAKEMSSYLAQAKASARMAIKEARIKLAKEALTEGFDVHSWDVVAWEKELADLKKDPEGALVEVGSAADNEAVQALEEGKAGHQAMMDKVE